MKNIVVIYGGGSCEKDISVITALQAMESLDKNKYNVFPQHGQSEFFANHLKYALVHAYRACQMRRRRAEAIERIVARLGFPIIVKPANQGSSIGIGIASDIDELNEKLNVAFYYDKKVVLEKALTDFKEINCACLTKVYDDI